MKNTLKKIVAHLLGTLRKLYMNGMEFRNFYPSSSNRKIRRNIRFVLKDILQKEAVGCP